MSDAGAGPPALHDGRAPDFSLIVRSLAWRFVRHGWSHILLTLLILCGLPTFLYVMIRMADAVTATNLFEAGGSLKYLYFLMTMGTLPTLVLFEIMRVRQLYTLPVTTQQIVHVQLALGIAAVIGLYLVTVAYYRIAFGALIPVVGPLLFLIPGLVIAAGLGALLVDARWWKFSVVIAALAIFARESFMRFTDPFLEADGFAWFTPSSIELVILFVLAVVGYVLVMHTAVRDRRGETQSWAILEEYFHRLVTWLWERLPLRRPRLTMSSPLAAQLMFEWRTKGIVLPVVAVVFGTLSLIGAYEEPHVWFQAYTMSIPLVLMFGMAINGYFVGLMDGPDVKGPMDRYRATRPLSDWQLAAGALKNGLVSTLVALVITIALACLVYVYACLCGYSHGQIWSGLFDASSNLFRPGVLNYVGAFATLAMLGWAGMGFNLSCLSTGRHWLVMTVWLGGISLLLLSIILEKQLVADLWAQVMQTAAMVIAVLAVSAALFSYRKAMIRGLIPGWVTPAGAALGVLAAGLSYSVVHQQTAAAGTVAVVCIGLGAFVALPLASAPLAIAWNRHR